MLFSERGMYLTICGSSKIAMKSFHYDTIFVIRFNTLRSFEPTAPNSLCKRIIVFIIYHSSNSPVQEVQQLSNREYERYKLPSRTDTVHIFDPVPFDGHLASSNGEGNRWKEAPYVSYVLCLINIIRFCNTSHCTRCLAVHSYKIQKGPD